jgi:PGF-CTERM protein
VVLALVLAVLTFTAAAAGPALALAQQDPAVADGRTGGVDPGREDDEAQQFPINYTFRPTNHQPGATGTGFEVYASGITENITGHWVVLESADFGFSECAATDASVFGIDRGNDDSGTTTDESLLTAYESYTSTTGGIYIEFAKESGVTGDPIEASVYDQLVAKQNNCMTNPSEPGWYRVNGHINGSTKHDTTTDYTVFAEAQYTYICDCDSRQEAREKLGPPPNERSGESSPTPTATRTADSTATSTPTATAGESTPTATAGSSKSTASTTSTTTTTPPTGTVATGTATANSTGSTTGPSSPGGTTTGGSAATDSTPSPSDASGPGFGLVVALLALVASSALAVRRKN